MSAIANLALVAAGILSAATASAADLPTEQPVPAPIPEPLLPSTWHFEATLDGFAPSMNASMGVRNLPSLPVYASIFKILPHLEGIVPVSAVAYVTISSSAEAFSGSVWASAEPLRRGRELSAA